MSYPNINEISKSSALLLKDKLYQKYKESFDNLDNCYIFGTGLLGQFVYQEFQKNGVVIQGFLDNNSKKHGELIEGLKIHSIEEANKECVIVIASLMYWYEMKEQLQELGFSRFFCYEELALACSSFSNYNQSFYHFFATIEEQRDCYHKMLEKLVDEKSKQILDAIAGFRISLDVEFTKQAYDLSIIEGQQYFDRAILKSKENEVFLDGGGYDGDSIKDFISWNLGNYQKILFFEPDANMVKRAKENLQKVERINYFSKALGSSNGNIRYDASGNQTGAGQIKDSGDAVVEMCTIDSLNENITLLKLDTEGYEMEILQGAKNTIQTGKPRIMLAVYHKAGDIYDICKFILDLNPSYQVHMRHYTKVYADTVLYFV